MPQATANDITIEYDVQGDDSGVPLLLIMGLGAQLIHWPQGFVDELVDRGFKVIRFDNRDAGLSTEFDWEPPSRSATLRSMVTRREGDVQYTLRDMAADAVGLLDALGIESAHVVGASMGGMIAQVVAAEHPARTRSLTSIMSNTGDGRNGLATPSVTVKFLRHKPERDTAAETGTELYSSFVGSAWDREEHLARARAAVERSFRPNGLLRQMAATQATGDRTAMLGSITAPTLVVHGLADGLVRPSGGIATAKAIPGSQLLMFADMGHDLPRTRWVDMADAIRAIADRGENRRSAAASGASTADGTS